MDAPLVSVIVPNYNYARYLEERIESILTQRFQDFELILLDDCSTDESRSIPSQGQPLRPQRAEQRQPLRSVGAGASAGAWTLRMDRGE